MGQILLSRKTLLMMPGGECSDGQHIFIASLFARLFLEINCQKLPNDLGAYQISHL